MKSLLVIISLIFTTALSFASASPGNDYIESITIRSDLGPSTTGRNHKLGSQKKAITIADKNDCKRFNPKRERSLACQLQNCIAKTVTCDSDDVFSSLIGSIDLLNVFSTRNSPIEGISVDLSDEIKDCIDPTNDESSHFIFEDILKITHVRVKSASRPVINYSLGSYILEAKRRVYKKKCNSGKKDKVFQRSQRGGSAVGGGG